MSIERWDAAACERGVRQLFGLADELDSTYERLRASRTRLATGWRGAAADQALRRIDRAIARVSALTGRIRQAADTVRSGLAGFGDAARMVGGGAQSPRAAADAVALARSVDDRVAAGLGSQGSAATAPGGTPADVARWWTALPPAERDELLAHRPDALGGLAGLPAAVRDEANRRRLAILLVRLRAERDRWLTTTLPTPLNEARAAVLRSMVTVAESVERTLAGLAGRRPPARLLTLDLAGTGRVAIGLGDVDRARHVAVVVPGMGEDANHGVPGTVSRADRLLTEAGHQSSESTAVIAWVGYAAPSWRQVPFTARALAGGRLLSADLAALDAGRSADGGEPAHVTLVGHSYGSTVVGAAAQVGPRRADDLVLLGSPGVLARDVTHLGLNKNHVYVGEAPLDPVADLGTFGGDPGDPAFGATRVRADPEPGLSWADRAVTAHSRYFDPGSESLRNIARVVVGRGGDTTRLGEAA